MIILSGMDIFLLRLIQLGLVVLKDAIMAGFGTKIYSFFLLDSLVFKTFLNIYFSRSSNY